MAEKVGSLFQRLYDIDVSDKVEKKNGLSYLPWSFSWAEVKKVVPEATFTVYERETDYGPVNYFTDGRTCWVKTGITLCGLEHIEMLPVMDFRNNAIPLEKVTSTDVNKAIQRSLTKAAARHGLGLYVYAGEDLPENDREAREKETIEKTEAKQKEEFEKIDAKLKKGEMKKDSAATVINTDKLPWG